nr:major capsid protein [Paraburkholderia kururiensis]
MLLAHHQLTGSGRKAYDFAYLNTQQAATLRGDPTDSFDYGGITWERYKGRFSGVGFIDDDEALAVPQDVPELCITRFAPADYMETVNTVGLPYYAKQEILPFAKGVALEAQSNPIHLPTRPKAIVRIVDVLEP